MVSNPNGAKGKALTHDAIVAKVKVVQAAVAEWQTDQKAPLVKWRGIERKAVTETVMQAAVALFEFVNTLDIHPTAQALVLAIDRFDDEFTKWAELCTAAADRTDPSGTTAVWNAFQEMLEAMRLRVFPRPEPIPALLSQKVPYRQIAKIYGWVDAGGNPDVTKVQEEITTPGKHYNPDAFKPRAQLRHEEEICEQWLKREDRLGKRRAYAQATAPHAKERGECPESIEELLRAGVNGPQVAKMHGVSLEEVRAVAQELGIPFSGNATGAAFLQIKDEQEEERIKREAEDMRLQAINTHPELGNNQSARISAMAADGLPSSDIAKALAAAFPGMTRQQVTAALAKQREQETVKA